MITHFQQIDMSKQNVHISVGHFNINKCALHLQSDDWICQWRIFRSIFTLCCCYMTLWHMRLTGLFTSLKVCGWETIQWSAGRWHKCHFWCLAMNHLAATRKLIANMVLSQVCSWGRWKYPAFICRIIRSPSKASEDMLYLQTDCSDVFNNYWVRINK